MIEFVTLLFGLVAGPRTVEVSVGEEVHSVEILLDGASQDVAVREPWLLDCDFGEELAPHELVAVARDADHRELARTRQWVNLPQARSQARLMLERSAGGGATARLIWSALDRREPLGVRLTFDGQPLASEDLDAIALPPHDPRGIHLLRAEIEISEHQRDTAELVFGGGHGDTLSTELTAVVLAAPGRLPVPERMSGWLRRRGEPLEVVAVEQGPVNLLIVREQSAATLDGLRKVYALDQFQSQHSRQPPVKIPVLADGDRVRFVYPTAAADPLSVGRGAVPVDVEQMPVSRDATSVGSLFEILTHGFSDQEVPVEGHPLADAVAVAGVVAASGNQRRAVILIRSGAARDTSRFTETTVRAYLSRLRVPLAVWEIPAAEGAPSAWGEGRDVSNLRRMNRAVDELRKALKQQVVVWVSGAHLAHEIELDAAGSGLRPVG